MPTDSIKELFGNISQQLGVYLPRIAGAAIILFVGWIVAHLLARIVRLGTMKTGVDQHLARYLTSSGVKPADASGLLGKVAFYIAMLFVLVAFFNSLSLPIVSTPLNAFLGQVFEYAPRVFSAAILAFVGWIIARLVREGSRRGLIAMDVDSRLAAIGQDMNAVTTTAKNIASQPSDRDLVAGAEILDQDAERANELINVGNDFEAFETLPATTNGDEVKLSQSLPEAAYWLIIVLFLPAVLGALKIPGLLEPIQSMFAKAMGYLPNILGATIIFVIGMFIAKMIRIVISNLTASVGVDRLAQKAGLSDALSNRKLSDILGVAAYALVLLPILVAALNALDIDAVTQPAGAVLNRITSLIPGFLGAGAILVISYFIGKIVSDVVADLLEGIGFNEVPAKLGLITLQQGGSIAPAKLAGQVLLVVIMLFSVLQALPMMGLDMFAVQLQVFIGFAVQVLMGLAIIALGIYLAKITANFVRQSGVEHADHLAKVAYAAILIFAGAIGLQRMGLAPSIVNLAFGTILGGLGLASAIAFGWGGRDAAKRLIERYIG